MRGEPVPPKTKRNTMLDLPTFPLKTEPYDHQRKLLEATWAERGYCLFLEKGTGKSKICIDTIAAREEDEPLLLGWVMAAREHEDIEVPIAYPRDDSRGRISRVVIFGDSLTDSGRLKRRLMVFPEKPYWLGRFSNGPVWPEYLAMATDVAVQNNAYGGASVVYLDQLPGAGIITSHACSTPKTSPTRSSGLPALDHSGSPKRKRHLKGAFR